MLSKLNSDGLDSIHQGGWCGGHNRLESWSRKQHMHNHERLHSALSPTTQADAKMIEGHRPHEKLYVGIHVPACTLMYVCVLLHAQPRDQNNTPPLGPKSSMLKIWVPIPNVLLHICQPIPGEMP